LDQGCINAAWTEALSFETPDANEATRLWLAASIQGSRSAEQFQGLIVVPENHIRA
jgi:hypothetical protein